MEIVKFPVIRLIVLAATSQCVECIVTKSAGQSHGYVPEEVPYIFKWNFLLKKALFVMAVLIGLLLYIVPESRRHARKGCHKVIDLFASGLKSIIGQHDYPQPSAIATADSFTSPDAKYSYLQNYSYALARECAKNMKKTRKIRRHRSDSSDMSERECRRHERRKSSRHGDYSDLRHRSHRERHTKYHNRNLKQKSSSKYSNDRDSTQKLSVMPLLYSTTGNCDICHRASTNLQELRSSCEFLISDKNFGKSSTQIIMVDKGSSNLASSGERKEEVANVSGINNQVVSNKNELKCENKICVPEPDVVCNKPRNEETNDEDPNLLPLSTLNSSLIRLDQAVYMMRNASKTAIDPIIVRSKEEFALEEMETGLNDLKRAVKEIEGERMKVISSKPKAPCNPDNTKFPPQLQNRGNQLRVLSSHTSNILNIVVPSSDDDLAMSCSGYNQVSTLKRTWNWLLNKCPIPIPADAYLSDLYEN